MPASFFITSKGFYCPCITHIHTTVILISLCSISTFRSCLMSQLQVLSLLICFLILRRIFISNLFIFTQIIWLKQDFRFYSHTPFLQNSKKMSHIVTLYIRGRNLSQTRLKILYGHLLQDTFLIFSLQHCKPFSTYISVPLVESLICKHLVTCDTFHCGQSLMCLLVSLEGAICIKLLSTFTLIFSLFLVVNL